MDERTLSSIRRQDREFADLVEKWTPKIGSIVRTLVKTLGGDPEDLQQDVLMSMWSDVRYWRQKTARIDGQLWEITRETAESWTLARFEERQVVPAGSVEVVRKAQLSSFVYTGLIQYCSDRLTRHFTEKNGWSKDKNQPTVERTHFDRTKRELVTRARPNLVRTGGEVRASSLGGEEDDETELDRAASPLPSPEETVAAENLSAHLYDRLSPPARSLLEFLTMENEDYFLEVDAQIAEWQASNAQTRGPKPKADTATAAKYFGCSKKEVDDLWQEIVRHLPPDTVRERLGRA